jgi:hypothetical protein
MAAFVEKRAPEFPESVTRTGEYPRIIKGIWAGKLFPAHFFFTINDLPSAGRILDQGNVTLVLQSPVNRFNIRPLATRNALQTQQRQGLWGGSGLGCGGMQR